MTSAHVASQVKGDRPGRFIGLLGLLYALAGFAVGLAAFAYAVPFLANFKFQGVLLVHPTIDIGSPRGVAPAVAIDLGLIMLFGLQHSIMARDGFKSWLRRYVPDGLERATYVHASNLVLWAVLLFWQPVPVVLLDLSGVRGLLGTTYLLGWLLVLIASFNLDLLELWGLRQAWSWSQGRTYTPRPIKVRRLYRQVRHPIYSGLIIVFWLTPVLTVGHALLAAGMTAYMLIGARFEERDLLRKYGDSYRQYQRAVPAFLPRLRLIATAK
jgi:methanethiol S-methyltransferase